MRYVVPVKLMVFPDLVALFVPRLKEVVDAMLAEVNSGYPVTQESKWEVCTWPGDKHGLVLQVTQGDLEFAINFPPHLWERLPEIMDANTIGIVVDRELWLEEDGLVAGLDLDDNGRLEQTMFRIYNVHRGLKQMPETLKAVKPNWNPNGILTYLLHILGEPLEAKQ